MMASLGSFIHIVFFDFSKITSVESKVIKIAKHNDDNDDDYNDDEDNNNNSIDLYR